MIGAGSKTKGTQVLHYCLLLHCHIEQSDGKDATSGCSTSNPVFTDDATSGFTGSGMSSMSLCACSNCVSHP